MTIEVHEFDPATLKPSPVNKRTFAKDDSKDPKIVELSQSIDRDGQVQPIVVRPVNGHYEIVCGERRTRACRLLKRKVLAIERDLDDKQAAMLTAAENAERENLTPVEEAETFHELVRKGWTHAEIADHLKMPLSHVIRRMQLTHLSKKWREVATDPEGFTHAWNAVHYEKIAKFPADVQDAILQALKGRGRDLHEVAGWTTKTLAGYLAQFLHSIDSAPWKKDDETLVVKAGSCAACKKRSDCQADLFEDDDLVAVDRWGHHTGKVKKGARCLDPDCWESKLTAHLKAKESELAQAHNAAPIILADQAYQIQNWPQYEKHPYRKRVERTDDYQACKESDKGAKPALIVDGPRQGHTVFVKKHADSGERSGSRSTHKKPAEKKSLKDRRANLEVLRSRILAVHVIEKIEAIIQGGKFEGAKINGADLLATVLVFGLVSEHVNRNERFKTINDLANNRKHNQLVMDVFLQSLKNVIGKTREAINESQWHKKPVSQEFVKGACDLLNIDYKALVEQVRAEKPEPKSWAKEADDTKAAPKPAKAKASAKSKLKAKAKPAKKAKKKARA